MADGLYVTMNGAAARAAQLEAIADNLANAQTPGFKAARPAFETFLPASGADDKAYTAAVATGFDLQPGPTSPTDNPLDVLPEGDAFLGVQLPGGAIAYTRDGRLSLDSERRLTSSGRPVIDASGDTISIPPGVEPRVDASGAVYAGAVEVGRLGLFRLGGAVDRVGASALVPAAGGVAEPVEDGRVRTGVVELGNAGALEATVDLIAAQRSFDASMQALQTYKRMDERVADVARVR
ncbi:MAG TPA: flagellar hook basal-body protein [Anaeromyxobacteraceae bacterium]|nr:flagellar hook basal-body protein [Anaeromyxobacteraceae bacterium]